MVSSEYEAEGTPDPDHADHGCHIGKFGFYSQSNGEPVNGLQQGGERI